MTVISNPISIHRYMGLSTDTKPTIAAPLGMAPPTKASTFYEYDTGILYVTYDGTNWVPKDLGSRRAWTFGEPMLKANGDGKAIWTQERAQAQKGTSGWQARLKGGTQDDSPAGSNWAACWIPVNELPVTNLSSALWTYYLYAAQVYGFNLVIWVHDPDDFSKRAEITQGGSVEGLGKAQYWNSHVLDTTVDQFFWYGENITASGLSSGTATLHSWDDYQADVEFSTYTIYRISIEYGWYTTGEFTHGWLTDLKLNDDVIYLKPDDASQLARVRPTTYRIGYMTSYHTAQGDTELLSHAGYVYWIEVVNKNNTRQLCYIKDGSSIRWATGLLATQYQNDFALFDPPIYCSSSIVLNLGELCEASVNYTYGTLLEDAG